MDKKPRPPSRKKKSATAKAADALADILPMPGLKNEAAPPADPAAVLVAAKPVLIDRNEQLRKIVENPPPRPSSAAFLDHWFALRGGPAQFALDLCREYDAAEPGTQVRQRIIELVMRTMNLTDKKDGANDDMGLLTDDDLFRMMRTVGERILAADEAKGK